MYSARELLALQFERPSQIIHEGLLDENSIMIIGGPPKSYKSFLAKTIGLHLATGENLFGAYRTRNSIRTPAFPVERPVRVLYLEQEIGVRSLQTRTAKIAANLNGTQDAYLDNFFSHSTDRDLRLDTHDGLLAIGRQIEQAKPEVVILDPLIEFHGQDENSSAEMSNVMRGVDSIRSHYKVAMIIAHHAAKANGTHYGPDRLRGSSILFGKSDCVLMLDVHNRGAGIIKVNPTLRRDKPIRPFLLKMDWQSLTYRFFDWYSQKSSDQASKETPPES